MHLIGGHRMHLTKDCLAVPISELHDFLLEYSAGKSQKNQ